MFHQLCKSTKKAAGQEEIPQGFSLDFENYALYNISQMSFENSFLSLTENKTLPQVNIMSGIFIKNRRGKNKQLTPEKEAFLHW